MDARKRLLERYPGLLIEAHRNGKLRYRVRVVGEKSQRMTIPVGPENPNFSLHYEKARSGLLISEDHWMMSNLGKPNVVRAHVAKMLVGAKKRAGAVGREFALTAEDVLDLLSQQKCTCALSGIEFDLSLSATRRRPFAPSLDRISSKGGYTKGNVRLLCVVVNLALGDWGDEVLQSVARHIVLHGVPRPPDSIPPEIAALAKYLEKKRKSGPRR